MTLSVRCLLCFNPRVLAGGRDTDVIQHIDSVLFQSTRPRGRTRLGNTFFVGSLRPVSIHASSREDATFFSSLNRQISSFNPRVLAGGRDHPLRILQVFITFQSTRPRGRTRRLMLRVPWNTILFQSTRPRGRTRLRTFSLSRVQSRFNPRVLAGGRDGECRKQYKSKCYICKSAKEIILIINEEQYHFS